MTITLISAAIGLIAAAAILYMVRRDKMMSRDAAGWIIIAIIVAVLAVFPRLTDWVGQLLGVGYPPILPVLAALVFIVIKLVKSDIERAVLKADIERLMQHQAILESQLKERENGAEK